LTPSEKKRSSVIPKEGGKEKKKRVLPKNAAISFARKKDRSIKQAFRAQKENEDGRKRKNGAARKEGMVKQPEKGEVNHWEARSRKNLTAVTRKTPASSDRGAGTSSRKRSGEKGEGHH